MINFNQQFLTLYQRVEPTVIEHERMDKHLFGDILNGEKSIADDVAIF